jgi:glycosyltransferase involved in cell wall biosynthesis
MSGPPPDRLRVVIDLRPLQEPERAPITASYLSRLTAAFAADPAADLELLGVVRWFRPDPLPGLRAAGLPIAGRRALPPTSRIFRSAAVALDPMLQRAAMVRSRGHVFHVAGGALPATGPMPVVATLLDLAPWELPERYARSAGARLARHRRTRALREASKVLVTSAATAAAATELLGLEADRLAVVPLAPDPAFADPGAGTRAAATAAELGLPERYLVVGGRYDARSDLRTVLQALAALARQAPSKRDGPWPPRLVLVGAGGHDRRGRNRVEALVEHFGVDDLVFLTPPLPDEQRAAVTAGARGHVQAALSEAGGLSVLDALAAGVPVLASRTGCLPEIVGPAGIVVEPRDAPRMAKAMRALWEDGDVSATLQATARERAEGRTRSWQDVARETRERYREAVEAQVRDASSAVRGGTR